MKVRGLAVLLMVCYILVSCEAWRVESFYAADTGCEDISLDSQSGEDMNCHELSDEKQYNFKLVDGNGLDQFNFYSTMSDCTSGGDPAEIQFGETDCYVVTHDVGAFKVV